MMKIFSRRLPYRESLRQYQSAYFGMGNKSTNRRDRGRRCTQNYYHEESTPAGMQARNLLKMSRKRIPSQQKLMKKDLQQDGGQV
jgi:hypothetical protein